VDLGLVSGLMNWSITDDRFAETLAFAKIDGIDIEFEITPLDTADHPNSVEIFLEGESGKTLTVAAKSIGGGLVEFSQINGWPVHITGKEYVTLIKISRAVHSIVEVILETSPDLRSEFISLSGDEEIVTCRSSSSLDQTTMASLSTLTGVQTILTCPPEFYAKKGETLFSSSAEMVSLSEQKKCSLGNLILQYEAALLGLSEEETLQEMVMRYEIMRESAESGLIDKNVRMQLLNPTARTVFQAEKTGNLPIGGIHTRSAARALSVLHVSNSMGVICAAPTGASAGVIPGVIVSLAEDFGLTPKEAAMLLFAAGGIGLIVSNRATFAAEIAGCQVEIGAASAMAAASVVEWAGGSAQLAVDAAAISFQNTMGSVCDLVQGICEIPCHTRNAASASAAFTNADLIMGGYENSVPLDETIDAVFSVGKMIPSELRVTALGGLALAPSARSMNNRDSES
ncbi:L-serine ammonia-lyase, iron-sulfur-dependent, subunit alpha, partial [Acidobacteriota bacterium]